VHKYMRTHGSEGATEPGRYGPGPPVGLAHFEGRFGPPFHAPEDPSTLSSWRLRHSQDREPFTPRGHPQAREKRRQIVREKKEALTIEEEGRHRRKLHHDQRCRV
jgi:hypothetical protein